MSMSSSNISIRRSLPPAASDESECLEGKFRQRSVTCPTTPRSFVKYQPDRESIKHPELPAPLPGILTTSEIVDVGAYGSVFRGVWTRLEGDVVPVAIKAVRKFYRGRDEDAGERFNVRVKREALIWNRANHPNVLGFLGYQIADGVPMLVSRWCENGSLLTYTRRHPEMTNSLKLRLLRDAARGLDYLHSRNPPIIHGDIKPENVLVTENIRGALCDFGISRLMDTLGDHEGLGGSGLGLGLVGYQAKELLLGVSQSTTMSDVYAFGGVILATMSGKPPFFKKRTAAAIILAICRDEAAKPADHPELPADDTLWDLLGRCWNAEPGNRPSINEIISELNSRTNDALLAEIAL